MISDRRAHRPSVISDLLALEVYLDKLVELSMCTLTQIKHFTILTLYNSHHHHHHHHPPPLHGGGEDDDDEDEATLTEGLPLAPSRGGVQRGVMSSEHSSPPSVHNPLREQHDPALSV